MIDLLLAQLVERDIRIRRDGDRLIVDAPPATMTDDLRGAIRAHKPELLALPACDSCARWPLLLPESRAVGTCLRCMAPEQYMAAIRPMGDRRRREKSRRHSQEAPSSRDMAGTIGGPHRGYRFDSPPAKART